MYNTYVESGSTRKKGRRFWHKFQDVTVPHRKIIHRIVNKLRETGLLLDKNPESKCRMLTEEKSDESSATLEQSPWKSFRCLV
jgi:hypothetical protein